MSDLRNEQLVRPSKAARIFDVSVSTIYYWIATGKLEAVKLPGKTIRIRVSALEDAQKSTLN